MKLKSDAKVDALAQAPMFGSFSQRDLKHVARIADEIEVHEGDHLCEQGDHGDWCFVLVDTEADVLVDGRQVAALHPGALCGELSLLDGGPRAATIVVKGDGHVLLMPRQPFLDLLASTPKLTGMVLASMGERLRSANFGLASSVTAGG